MLLRTEKLNARGVESQLADWTLYSRQASSGKGGNFLMGWSYHREAL